jgi:GNAT superfamily N-acetyltransferase
MNSNLAVNIRSFKNGDGENIFRMIQELAAFEKLDHQVIGTARQLEAHLAAESPAVEALIAQCDEGIVAYALFFGTYSTFRTQAGIYLEDLYVTPKWRGQGIGKRLLARLAKLAQSRDCGRLEWSVLDWNREAIRFYESLGAFPQNEWTMFRLTDEALLNLAAKST